MRKVLLIVEKILFILTAVFFIVYCWIYIRGLPYNIRNIPFPRNIQIGGIISMASTFFLAVITFWNHRMKKRKFVAALLLFASFLSLMFLMAIYSTDISLSRNIEWLNIVVYAIFTFTTLLFFVMSLNFYFKDHTKSFVTDRGKIIECD